MLGKNLRIVVAGDSLGLPRIKPTLISYKDIWPYILEGKLKERNVNSKILNHSERSRTLPKLLKNFQDIVSIWEPDILIIQIGIVDCAPRLFSEREHKFLNSGIIHWRIAKAIINFASKHRRQIITLRPWVRYTPLKKFKKSLEDLGKILSQTNYKTIVLPIFPSFPSHTYRSPGYNESVEKYNNEWKNFCEKYSHIFINLEEIINDLKLEDLLLEDGHHLSKLGHLRIATSLENKILEIINGR